MSGLALQKKSTSQSVPIHQEEFDRLYRPLNTEENSLDFPLEEIERFQWHRGPHGDAIYSYYYRRFTVFTLGLLQVKDTHQVLNIGCGYGFDEKNLFHLYPRVELWSVDLSREMILKAYRNRCPARLCLSLAEALPFADESFDRILAREVIEHVLSPASMIQEISRCLKPGGVAVITTEFESSLAHLYTRLFFEPWACHVGLVPPHAPYQNESPPLRTIKQISESAGLVLERVVWDGALYQLCTSVSFQKLFRSKAVSIAKFFARLENIGKGDRYFCDQIKIALRKPTTSCEKESPPRTVEFRCPVCHGELQTLSRQWQCVSCNRGYPKVNEVVPNLIVYDWKVAEKSVPLVQSNSQLGLHKKIAAMAARSVFQWVEFVVRRTYLFAMCISAAALVCYRFFRKEEKIETLVKFSPKLARYLRQTRGRPECLK